MEISIFPDNNDTYGFLYTFSRYNYLLSQIMYGKCSKITNTKKIIIFSAVRNFRNYVSEKVLVFVI